MFMKKRGLLLLPVILLILVGTLLLYNFLNGDKKELAKTKQAVLEYLISEKGYLPTDIKEIRTVYSWKEEKRNAYIAFVTFVDEPNKEYEFIYNETEGIRERGANQGGKH